MTKQILLLPMLGLICWSQARSQSYFLLQYNLEAGGGRTTSSSYTSENTLGQSIVGADSTSGYQLGVGFGYQIPPLRNFLLMSHQVADGWNLLSLPVIPFDPRKSVLYPNATSNAFIYQGSYVPKDSVTHGPGFWLKFNGASTAQVPGSFIDSLGVAVRKGWNIIGSISTPIPVASITSAPPGLVTSNFFGYSSGYVPLGVIEPGTGSWVKVDSSGWLWLNGSTANAADRIKIVATSELPPSPPELIGGQSRNLPKEYALAQNYPNPFNPFTMIKFEIPTTSYVVLKVFDILGQEVITLVDGKWEPGTYDLVWDGSNQSSGVYFYRLQAGSFVETKKLMLLR